MREKIAMVCQRYGLEVNGGSETHCRHLAERLSAFYDVTVYTTCALDYATWEDHYSPGVETINGVTVRRFSVERPRDQTTFGASCGRVLGAQDHSDADEREWLDEQGPLCPRLLRKLWAERGQYKVVIFMTYLYYLTAMGLPMGFENALLVPTIHDEPPAYLRHYEKVFGGAKGFIWNTPIEREFAQSRFPKIKDTPGIIAGVGVDLPKGEIPDVPPRLRGMDYVTYVGRIDTAKGCEEMFDFFLRYKRENGGDLKLVLVGKPVMEVPPSEDIISLGFVSEEIKYAVMREAKALVLFSRFESLSAVVLESMVMGRPVIVTEHCPVLKEHCLRSNAGLWFQDYPEFAAVLNYMLSHEQVYQAMRENGKRYVEENYQWDRIIEKIRDLIERTAAAS